MAAIVALRTSVGLLQRDYADLLRLRALVKKLEARARKPKRQKAIRRRLLAANSERRKSTLRAFRKSS